TSPRVDPYSLRLFVSTAREGSIARAAQREHIAASALSRRIADLEHAFGSPLFVRSPRGIELTEAGQLVLQRGLQIDQDLQNLAREVQALHGQDSSQIGGQVRLAANLSAIIGFLPERLKAFSAACPRVAVSLTELDTRDVLRACLDDQADLGVGVRTEPPPGLEAWPFAEDPLIVVLPRGHALARQRSVRLQEALAWPLIGIHAGGALDSELRARALAAGLTLHSPVSVSGFDAACRMVEAGLGIALIPLSAAKAYAGTARFVRRPLAEPWAARELCLYALRKTPRLRPVQALIDALKA
ncbi:LysR family transcriptional regulator, partial [Ramlibacter sp. 2FC]|uniref:LysR family transcriptional regulator n=1 Tax=Ramlibacter sp. 2FC TaxID=2502188 RepID=UPI00201E5D30